MKLRKWQKTLLPVIKAICVTKTMLVISSLKYSIGLEKEMQVLIDQSRKCGIDTYFWGHRNYSLSNRISFFDILLMQRKERKFVYFYNFQVYQPLLYFFFYFLNIRMALMLHEPYKAFRELRRYGLKKGLIYGIILFLQRQTSFFLQFVFVASPHARDLALSALPKRIGSRVREVRLLLDTNHRVFSRDKSYFSVIGHLNKDKNIKPIIKIVNDILSGSIQDTDLRFVVATSSSKIPNLEDLKPGWQKYLEIYQKNFTDEEIDNVISQSKAVLCLHSVASQSGVYALATKFGVPVVARQLPAFEQFNISNDELLLSGTFDSAELKKALDYVDSNTTLLSQLARRVFDENFAADNYQHLYADLIEELVV